MRKNLITSLLIGASAMAASLATGTVTATAHPDDCPKDYVCVWGDSNFNGRFHFEPGPNLANVGPAMNDLTTSLWNRTNSTVCFYDDANYGGKLLARVAPGESRANVGTGANDRITSWKAC